MGSSTATRLPLPPEPGLIALTLELPGGSPDLAYSVRVSRIGANGFAPVWSAPDPLRSNVENRLNLSISADQLPAGDYVIEVSAVDGPLRATYVLRTVVAQKKSVDQ